MDDLANRSIYFTYGFADCQSGRPRQAPDGVSPELQEAWLDGWDEAHDQLTGTRRLGA